MVENNSIELTEQETELYDRQIRLWGLDSQKRDVVKHKEGEKNKSEMVTSTAKRTVCFPPLQDVLEFDYTEASFVKKIKRTGPSFIVLKVLQKFCENFGRDPSHKSRSDDLAKLLAIRDEIAANLAPDSAFVHVFAQISPVAAFVGGELSQEIIKAVSQKEAPHNNLFLFDPATCCGYVETIAN